MELFITAGTFIAVALLTYGLLYRTTGNDALDSRLGGLRYTRIGKDSIPDPDAAFSKRVIRPLVQGATTRIAALLPSTMSERIEGALVQAGLKIKPGQFIAICGVLMGVMPVVAVIYGAAAGIGGPMMLLLFVGAGGLAVYGPRMWLLGRIKKRQKAIWRSLPDAFDLVTASVEAGLGIDAAFTRVIDKVHGPFAEELSKTMREISMGRSRRDAFVDMADRTGVEELRSLVNAVVQAEAMGISIGSVIRVQTGVIRTKRRQKAEEQAFKAPVKMVFPLVFFIFPAIMVVIGGPAAINLKDAF